jgi:hypothetical protein
VPAVQSGSSATWCDSKKTGEARIILAGNRDSRKKMRETTPHWMLQPEIVGPPFSRASRFQSLCNLLQVSDE